MKFTSNLLIVLLTLITLQTCSNAQSTGYKALLEQAQNQDGERYDYAVDKGVQVLPTADQKSFSLLWYPDAKHKPKGVIVSIHGHGSWAFDEFYLWHEEAKKRELGILALQWWLGKGERFQDYLDPREMYRAIDNVLTSEGFEAKQALFHGFSRGSANSYAVVALDNTVGHHYFGLAIANSGAPGLDFPPNKEIESGKMGTAPLQGTSWVTFAGAMDEHPDRDGIPGMRMAAKWITKYGGKVELAIEDPHAGHGGFHRNKENMKRTLDLFQKLL